MKEKKKLRNVKMRVYVETEREVGEERVTVGKGSRSRPAGQVGEAG